MAEQYIEIIVIRQDDRPEVSTPTFVDADIDGVYKFEGKIKLRKIVKDVRNASSNRHDYIFVIESIDEMEKQEE